MMAQGLAGGSGGNRQIIKDAFTRQRMQNALAFAPGNTVFTIIPKVACTSLQLSFLAALGEAGYASDLESAYKRAKHFRATRAQIAEAGFTFTFHRDPFGRLASCFLDKIVNKPQKFLVRIAGMPPLAADTMTFRRWVGWLVAKDNLMANLHWRPQSTLLLYREYDRYVQFERLSEAAGPLSELCGFAFSGIAMDLQLTTRRYALVRGAGFADMPISEIRAMQAAGACPAHDQLYDPDLVRLVAALYAGDAARHAGLFGRSEMMFRT